jgi:hypothetical protein
VGCITLTTNNDDKVRWYINDRVKILSIKKQLQSSIYYVLKHNKHGSFKTQANRRGILMRAAEDLIYSGYKLKNIKNLKEKHIRCLFDKWRSENLSLGTLKNRRAVLQWVSEIIGKSNMVPTNFELGIANRNMINSTNKAIELSDIQLQSITDKNIYVSLQLQRVFGLRKEESLKIKPFIADSGDKLKLQGSWCKGGRAREIPILTDEQRYWLNEAKKIVKGRENSMIPKERSFKNQLNIFRAETRRAKIKHVHGLRHAYAQKRYRELTGWECPARGGPIAKGLSMQQALLDRRARLQISKELGHGRIRITAIYCGMVTT